MAILERDDVIPVVILGEFILTSLAVLQFSIERGNHLAGCLYTCGVMFNEM